MCFLSAPDIDQYGCLAGTGRESVAVMRSALYDGIVSATDDGRSVARLMGAFSASDGNSTYFDIGPSVIFSHIRITESCIDSFPEPWTRRRWK